MVASASLPVAANTYGSPFYFVIRHALALGLAVTAGLVCFAVPVRWWERSGPCCSSWGSPCWPWSWSPAWDAAPTARPAGYPWGP